MKYPLDALGFEGWGHREFPAERLKSRTDTLYERERNHCVDLCDSQHTRGRFFKSALRFSL